MSITTDRVLKKITEISKKHFSKKPLIGIDSLALLLGMQVSDLMELLIVLEFQGHLQIHNCRPKDRKHQGLTSAGQISLCEQLHTKPQ